ncbi:MAG: nucleotidyltransferase domain-containing protein, partial [Candidatus Poribacteria bacterium]|nr:nucleotidyltransferase domain-containing protein [Candidatus Poribacteria bacterium]
MSDAPNQETQERYQQALSSLVEKLEEDRTVVAAILFGSLSYDEVWKNSDIDLWLIMEDGQKEGEVTLCEYDVNIHAQRIPRSRFKRSIEGDLAGGWLDFSFSTSTLLFTKDDSVTQWYNTINHIGARDQALQLMRHASYLIPSLNKSEKYFYLKDDNEYSFLWLMYVVRELACIEVILHNEAPSREVIHQALKHNPKFFTTVYTDFVNRPKTREAVGGVLDQVNGYL